MAAHEAQATLGEHNENCAGGAARRVEEAERASVGGPESGLPRPRRATETHGGPAAADPRGDEREGGEAGLALRLAKNNAALGAAGPREAARAAAGAVPLCRRRLRHAFPPDAGEHRKLFQLAHICALRKVVVVVGNESDEDLPVDLERGLRREASNRREHRNPFLGF